MSIMYFDINLVNIYSPEVSSMKYLLFGNISGSSLHSANRKKPTKILVKLDSKNKKHLRVSAQATIHPLAIILTAAL